MNKALFLDRDGVINIEKEYLFKREDFEFIDGIFELCSYYADSNYDIFVVTNQSGIARGYYSEDDFLTLTLWMQKRFLEQGITLQEVYHCPHHPTVGGECSCRKPKAGMLLQAASDFDIDLKKSIMIGDKERDIEAGLNAGLCETYLLDVNQTISVSKATKIVSKLEDIWKEQC